jgi:SAM-dependent MidA family methyltransferase
VLTHGPLPAMDPAEAARSAALSSLIRARMADRDGWLPFSEFMRAALYEPELGYYAADHAIFGAEGDFVTAPELSPLFAACLSNGIESLLAPIGAGDVVEFGAGSGRMPGQLAPALARRGSIPRRYRIVEPSRRLAERQRRFLAQQPDTAAMLDRIEWRDAPPREPWQGVAFGNEVVDALPVDRFRVTSNGCEAIGVAPSGDGFSWEARPADPMLAEAVASIQAALPEPMPAGYVSEWRPGLAAWVRAAMAGLERGALLVIDYGLPRAQYYHPSRNGGTLCGFRRHQRVDDALAVPGAQDLTAWVDFTALADAARGAGLAVCGFATQAHYLLETGIDRELARLTEAADERDRAAHRQRAATLLLPGEMGERFKLMALARGIEGPIRGFGFRDLSASL